MTNERLISCTTSYPDLFCINKYYLQALGIFLLSVFIFFSPNRSHFHRWTWVKLEITACKCYVTMIWLYLSNFHTHTHAHKRRLKWIPSISCTLQNALGSISIRIYWIIFKWLASLLLSSEQIVKWPFKANQMAKTCDNWLHKQMHSLLQCDKKHNIFISMLFWIVKAPREKKMIGWTLICQKFKTWII